MDIVYNIYRILAKEVRSWQKIISRHCPADFACMAEIVGLDNAIEIAKQFGGATIYIPTYASATRYNRNERIKKDYRSGKTYSQISKRFGLSEMAVRKIICA